MDPITLVSVLVNVAIVGMFISILIICLKIKTTKKTPELLGTVGTVKTFDDDGVHTMVVSSPPQSLNTTRQSQLVNTTKASTQHNTSAPLVVIPPPSAPSPASLGNTSSAGHSPAPSPYYPEHRTPSRAGERKLPEIPRDSDNGSLSELYDTLGPPEANREASDSETETDGARANHPYARVKKRSPKEHPYATVSHHNRVSSNDDGLLTEHLVHEEHPDVPPPPTVHPPPPPPENAATTHFSGDSQDSSKGYTSISVREPLCHIQPAVTARSAITVPSRQNATYMAVSEASDDMYAAIEDPTYIPAGAISQTNSDTYAVINLPDYDSGSQTYQKLEGAEEEDEDTSSSAHTYSKIDKNKKKRAAVPPPPLPPGPHPPGAAMGQPPHTRPISFNVDDMYAKVQKSPPPRPDPSSDLLPVGASAMRANGIDRRSVPNIIARSIHSRSAHWDPATDETSRRIQRGEVNYSDYEVSHYDPKQRIGTDRRSGPVQPITPSPKFYHDPVRIERNLTPDGSNNHVINDKDGGYETVPEPKPSSRTEQSTICSPPRNEHGYEQVVEYWLRRPPGSVNTRPDFVGEDGARNRFVEDESARGRIQEHGYETLPETEGMVGYPPTHRVSGIVNEPPYAVLNSQDFDEEESEEGYETIPASERRSHNVRKDSHEDDPGYESVRKKGSVISYGYEVVASKSISRRESASTRSVKKDPGYETVSSPRDAFPEHDYETVTGVVNKKASTATDYGYETVENLHTRPQRVSAETEMRSMPPHIEKRRNAAPLPPLTSHSTAARSVSLSPKLSGTPPDPHSPSIRLAVRHVTAVPSHRPLRRSSVTVIELRSDDSRQSSPGFEDDDDTVNSGGEGTEVNTTIFV